MQRTQLGEGAVCIICTVYYTHCIVLKAAYTVGGGLYDLYCILYTLYSFNCSVHIWGGGGQGFINRP